jgi:hypothetical protein
MQALNNANMRPNNQAFIFTKAIFVLFVIVLVLSLLDTGCSLEKKNSTENICTRTYLDLGCSSNDKKMQTPQCS